MQIFFQDIAYYDARKDSIAFWWRRRVLEQILKHILNCRRFSSMAIIRTVAGLSFGFLG